MRTHTRTRARAHIHARTSAHTDTHTRAHTRTHTHTHTPFSCAAYRWLLGLPANDPRRKEHMRQCLRRTGHEHPDSLAALKWWYNHWTKVMPRLEVAAVGSTAATWVPRAGRIEQERRQRRPTSHTRIRTHGSRLALHGHAELDWH